MPVYEQQYIRDRIVVDQRGCWVWQQSQNGHGYAQASKRVDGTPHWRVTAGHRLSYEAFVRPIPHGAVLCHTCDNRLCVNPEHLRVGTQSDNIEDMLRKNRQGWVCALSETDVASARAAYADNFFTQAELAAQFGVGTVAMNAALRGVKRGQNVIAKVHRLHAAGYKRRDILAALPHVPYQQIDYWLYREQKHRKSKGATQKPNVSEELVFLERVLFREMLPIEQIARELGTDAAQVARVLASS